MSHRMYQHLASLLTYPEADYRDHLRAAMAAAPPSCAVALREFGGAALAIKLEELQERFTAAFDLNPKGTLDLGWHLFGEKYERGLLLVRMRQYLATYGIAESAELPDHLTHALRLLGAMQAERNGRAGAGISCLLQSADRDPAADFVGAIMFPAMTAILSAAEENAPYDLLLKAVHSFLQAEFPDVEPEAAHATLPIIESSRVHAAVPCAGAMRGDE